MKQSPDIMDPSALQKYYKDVDVSASSFFDNALAISRFSVVQLWSALGKPVDREEWGMTASTVNACRSPILQNVCPVSLIVYLDYNPPGNEIVFPAGIMQFPVFSIDVPQYLSYGAFASVAGHELSHGGSSLLKQLRKN